MSVEVKIKIRMPSKKKLASIPEDLMKNALPWMERMAPEMLAEIKRRTQTRGRGAVPGGQEYDLPPYTARYGRNRGKVDFTESGQMLDSLEPRIMWKKDQLIMSIRPYGKRVRARKVSRVPPTFKGGSLPVFESPVSDKWLFAEIEDQELVVSERVGNTKMRTEFELLNRVWVKEHAREGTLVEGDVADLKQLEQKSKTKIRYRARRNNRFQGGRATHFRDGTTVKAHWRTVPDPIRTRGRNRLPYWSTWLQYQIGRYYWANANQQAVELSGKTNAQVADALGRRYGRGKWGRSGRPRPWNAISGVQMLHARGQFEKTVMGRTWGDALSAMSEFMDR